MPNPAFFKDVFDELAVNGHIGDPNGKPAYAYLRVSSSEQAEDGRSGLPRQIRHVHEIGLQRGLKIAWGMVFADDHTGFEFRDRPSLTLLRREYSSSQRRASFVVIEHIDRLSRNADWHQGYLLDEMKQCGIEAVFWKAFSGRIERAVMGAVAQDAMEQAIVRMTAGKIEKARSGRITAVSTSAYGYRKVDSTGRESPRSRQDTYYAVYEPEAQVVRFIFEQIAFHGQNLRQITLKLQETFPPPPRAKLWRHGAVRRIISNPNYKGEFPAFRQKEVKQIVPTRDGLSTQIVKKRVIRPQDEWIIVPIPPIVDPEIWELANRILRKNQETSSRNGKNQYLLTGLIRCAKCGRSYSGWSKKLKRKSNTTFQPAYRCTSKCCDKQEKEIIGCKQPVISCRLLDNAVWSVICSIMLQPQNLVKVIESEFQGERNSQIADQARFLESQIKDGSDEDEKLYRAYVAGVFDETEYAERRKLLKERIRRLDDELEKIKGQIMTQAQFEEQKQLILAMSERIRESGLAVDAPFEIKKRIIKTVVDRIILDTREGWFRIEGAIPGTYGLSGNTPETPDGGGGNGDGGSGPIMTRRSAAVIP